MTSGVSSPFNIRLYSLTFSFSRDFFWPLLLLRLVGRYRYIVYVLLRSVQLVILRLF